MSEYPVHGPDHMNVHFFSYLRSHTFESYVLVFQQIYIHMFCCYYIYYFYLHKFNSVSLFSFFVIARNIIT